MEIMASKILSGGGVLKKVPENKLVVTGYCKVSGPSADLSGILEN